jgi:hypothetical protein
VRFREKPHPSCLRGLHFIYECDGPIDEGRLIDELNGVFSGRLVLGREVWGTRDIAVAILQFRFEVRVHARGTVVEWIHRQTASAADRAADRGAFQAALARSGARDDEGQSGASASCRPDGSTLQS